MRFTSAALSAMLSASALAYPGMQADMNEFTKRQGPPAPLPPPEPLNSGTSAAVQDIKDCLSTSTSCEVIGDKTYVNPGALGTSACAKDQCCVWDWIGKDLVALFSNSDGTCTEDARGAIRLGFHDAGAWSTTTGFGGADGSMLISPDEINRVENSGLQDIVGEYQTLWAKYKKFGVGAADLIQFGATVAAVVCPLGPRTRFWAGRKDGDGSSPTGLLPDVNSDADTLINLFLDKTISAGDLAALVGAHSTSEQDVVDPARAGAPQDTTPGVNDVLFYSQTTDPNAPAELFKFPSDIALANDARCSPSFQFFGSNANGQAAWNDGFARAYVRLSLLGTPNPDDLFECTEVLPGSVLNFVIPAPVVSSSSSTVSGPIASGTGFSSSANHTGVYPYSSTAPYSVPYTTSTIYATKTYTITVNGKPSVTKSKYTTTTVCPVGSKKTEVVPVSYFGPPGSYSYKPIITKATYAPLSYPSCLPKTVYKTVYAY